MNHMFISLFEDFVWKMLRVFSNNQLTTHRSFFCVDLFYAIPILYQIFELNVILSIQIQINKKHVKIEKTIELKEKKNKYEKEREK